MEEVGSPLDGAASTSENGQNLASETTALPIAEPPSADNFQSHLSRVSEASGEAGTGSRDNSGIGSARSANPASAPPPLNPRTEFQFLEQIFNFQELIFDTFLAARLCDAGTCVCFSAHMF